MSFTVTLSTVMVMLFYCVPGYALVRSGKIPQQAIASFAVFLIFVCSPFQTLYAMQQIEYSPYMLKYMLLSLILGLALMGGMLGLVYLLLSRRQAEVPYRICVCAAAMGNIGFMGLPLIQALMPEYPQMQAFASMFFLAMNIIMWSLVSFIMTRDRRYISLKKALINPSGVATLIGFILLFARVRLTGQLGGMVELLGRMATPVCMVILGMRLALVPVKPMFTSKLQYLAIALKLLAFPLLTLALVRLLPVERDYVRGVYILACAPVGNLVLSFSELLGEGQDVAANVVLLSTLLSLFTIPVMMLLI
jgi:predicted permease